MHSCSILSFGFSLSCTTFEVINLKITGVLYGASSIVMVSGTAKNTGGKDGKVLVQFSVKSSLGVSVPRPAKELQAFKKSLLEPGASENVTVEPYKYAVSFHDAEMECWRLVKGAYEVLVTLSATEIIGSIGSSIYEDFSSDGL